MKQGQGIALSRRPAKLPPVLVPNPLEIPLIVKVRVFSPHGVNLVQPGEEVVITSQDRVGATFPFRQEWT
jgi:hypothetical protein